MVLKFVWRDDKLAFCFLELSFFRLHKSFLYGILDKRFSNQLHDVDLPFDSLETLQSYHEVTLVAAFEQGCPRDCDLCGVFTILLFFEDFSN
jgi:hypothetical protein